MYRRRLIVSLVVIYNLFASQHLFAQDIQFTQFYTNVLYSNPAFAGSSQQTRIIAHQRLQWPALEASYSSSLVSVDTYLPKYNSGLGLYAIYDFQGAKIIKSSEIQAMYSFEFFSKNNKLGFRLATQAGLVNRSLDYTHLIFPDQVSQDGYLGGISASDETNTSKLFGDFSLGGMAYSKKMYLGYSAHHVNQPNQTFLDESSALPTKQTWIYGCKFVLEEASAEYPYEQSITPSLHYKSQGKSDQTDLGVYYLQNGYMAGFWYRGIPFLKRYPNNFNNESISVLFGYKFLKILNISYSYDFVISKLSRARAWGAHELNITFFPNGVQKHRTMKVLPCPEF
jgi:type IX secretion system PorP/SprF family membrane protein